MFVDRSSMQWSDRHPFESPRKHEFLSVSIRVHPRPISLSRIVDNGDSRPRYFTSQIIESHASSRIQSVTYAIPLPTFCYILTRRRFATAAFFDSFFVATKRCSTVVRNFRSPWKGSRCQLYVWRRRKTLESISKHPSAGTSRRTSESCTPKREVSSVRWISNHWRPI